MKSALVRASVAKTRRDSRCPEACSQKASAIDPATTKSRNGSARRSQRLEGGRTGMRMDRI